ncbi:MAG: hypothetical protein SPL89_03915 [Clostridia bacterium]|nr:hypothetical protein [Clostridia bacterium]
MCIDCTAEYFDVSVGGFEEKIEQYRAMDCSIFLPKNASEKKIIFPDASFL